MRGTVLGTPNREPQECSRNIVGAYLPWSLYSIIFLRAIFLGFPCLGFPSYCALLDEIRGPVAILAVAGSTVTTTTCTVLNLNPEPSTLNPPAEALNPNPKQVFNCVAIKEFTLTYHLGETL